MKKKEAIEVLKELAATAGPWEGECVAHNFSTGERVEIDMCAMQSGFVAGVALACALLSADDLGKGDVEFAPTVKECVRQASATYVKYALGGEVSGVSEDA